MANFNGEDFGQSSIFAPALTSLAPNNSAPMQITPVVAVVNRLGSIDQVPFKAVASTVKVYRGVISGSFVYSTGTPPVGATDIVEVQ